MHYPYLPVALFVGLSACASSPLAPDTLENCSGFADWRVSAYVLPYPSGASYTVDQANCSPPGNDHRGAAKYGYDFLMAIGFALSVSTCDTLEFGTSGCPTLPVNFRNTDPNPEGLVVGRRYVAGPILIECG